MLNFTLSGGIADRIRMRFRNTSEIPGGKLGHVVESCSDIHKEITRKTVNGK